MTKLFNRRFRGLSLKNTKQQNQQQETSKKLEKQYIEEPPVKYISESAIEESEESQDIHIFPTDDSQNESRNQNTSSMLIHDEQQPDDMTDIFDGLDKDSLFDISYSEDNSESTFSFGSSKEDDSFAQISNHGLSEDDDSFSSALHERSYRRDLERYHKTGKNAPETRYPQQNVTSKLPNLTIQTKQTKALLESRKQDIKQSTLTSPTTVATQLETPMSNVDNSASFPSLKSNMTPQIHMPVQLSRTSNSYPSVSMSFSSQDITSFDTSFMRQVLSSKERKSYESAYQELEFWNEALLDVSVESGSQSLQSAEIMMNIGASLIRLKKYDEALRMYKNVVTIWSAIHGEGSLQVAKGLDKVGLAASLCAGKENLEWALLALKESLNIRIKNLGPHHCDTVDTMNNIAGVLLRQNELMASKHVYLDVLTMRAHIFGNSHPSIAITSQTLGKVFFKLQEYKSALVHYQLASRVYQSGEMNLSMSHPLVIKVCKQIEATERMIRATEQIQRKR
ncbi:hypothetical protein CTEN210_17260 [Chaetoceros tenuissimus]|uniref:Kinesin light chain n=1 Tax=Chaetoceros tenuissimus TaxID=426638 RepID=A0AAD3HF27_9STRA|nr:hypothetical protein CTEN210_17260 [Chaetoceros tenuissimus]